MSYIYSISYPAIVRAKAIPREVALEKVEKKEKPDRVIFYISYNPQLPMYVSPPSYRNIGEPWSRILGLRRFFKIHLWLPIGDLLISGINSSEPEFQILLE